MGEPHRLEPGTDQKTGESQGRTGLSAGGRWIRTFGAARDRSRFKALSLVGRLVVRRICTALSGWVAWGRRIVAAPASHRPRWRTLPWCTRSLIAPTVLDRHGRIDTMDVIEVNDIGFEPLQASLAARPDVFGPAVRCW